jgi:hypothetical protein
MQPTNQPVSKTKQILLWVGLTIFFISMVVFWCWVKRGSAPADDSTPWVINLIGSLIIAWLFTMAGGVAYFVVLLTNCFTFNFSKPVWRSHKAKLFLMNIFVPLLPALGLGFALQPIVSPLLKSHGIDAAISNMIPIMLMIGILQVLQLKVLIWAPVEKRFITKRLLALGISIEQIKSGTMIGLSDPTRTSAGKGIIEDDMGVLWITPEQLIFYGDREQFGITRDQVVRVEQKGDTLSITALSGVTHIILHVRMADGPERQIRLHVEAKWTMSGKRHTMNAIAHQIGQWHSGLQLA